MIGIDLKLLHGTEHLIFRNAGSTKLIFDPVRRTYVRFQPEELVRQLFIRYLLDHAGISRSRIAVEKKVVVNGMELRFDLLVFDRLGQPWMVVECKSADRALDQGVIDQAGRYNSVLKAPFLCVSNGRSTLIYELDFAENNFKAMSAFPSM